MAYNNDMALTTKQAAERLEISLRRVQRLIQDGLLPAERIGRDWLIQEPDLNQFAQKPRKSGRPRKDKDNGKAI